MIRMGRRACPSYTGALSSNVSRKYLEKYVVTTIDKLTVILYYLEETKDREFEIVRDV